MRKKTPEKVIKLQKIPRDGAEHREDKAETQGQGGRRTRRHHQGTEEDWATGQGQQGRGEGVWIVEAVRERTGTLDGRTLGADRDLGAGQGRKRGGNHTSEGRHRLAQGTHWAA